jgi:hypothetical protein
LATIIPELPASSRGATQTEALDARVRERLHRPDLERTEPVRNAAAYLRDPGSAEGVQSKSKQPGSRDTADGAVGHGVKLGYKVIEEQIRKGQLLAQRLGKAHKVNGTGSGEIGVLIERTLHLYKDMGALYFDALETVARSPALKTAISSVWNGKTKAPAPVQTETETEIKPNSDTGMGAGFAIEVASTRRTQVTLDLRSSPKGFTPQVHALHAADPKIAPLIGVRFRMEPGLPTPALQVVIQDAQPPATYTGVVVDSATNEPHGTLCVRLHP